MTQAMTHSVVRICTIAAATTVLLSTALEARTPAGQEAGPGPAKYIVVLEEAPLVERLVRDEEEAVARLAQAGPSAGKSRMPAIRRPDGKLDLDTDLARAHLQAIDAVFSEFEVDAAAALGRPLDPQRRYRAALNGFSAKLSAAEARLLEELPGVERVERVELIPLHTFAGPEWIGAREVWDGAGFLPQSRGEGVIIGIIDSGINWDHPSFADPSNRHDHENPLGRQLGLCSEAEVQCNDKLIGVYDFTDDEQFNNGRDNTQHGTHVASTAAGNELRVTLSGTLTTLSGVAPNANLVSYRVCFPDDGDGPGLCATDAIIDAVEQAIFDGVDVLNLSLGGGQGSPWASGDDRALLNAMQGGITVVTSAGNNGPEDNTLTNPGIAPWAISVGSASAGSRLAVIARATQGGDTTPPGDLYGEAFQTEGVGLADIVYAGDFDHPLCGVGTPELEAECGANTGSTKPPEWDSDTFAGKIVVCDRGEFGRVEKGKNVQLAGAVGMILANTATSIQSVVPDEHCLPSAHIDREDGDRLRSWLATGTGHRGSITNTAVRTVPGAGDRLSSFSSRGPTPAVAPNVLKPELIAPGDSILAADGDSDNGFIFLSGTSMASPHVAGGAALVKSVRPDWTPRMIASALQTTATDEVATDENGVPATRNEVGHGRPRLGEAVQAALYFDESFNAFLAANPSFGGDPRTLNLPSMADAACVGRCSFTRTVRPLVGGLTWTVLAEGFPPGADVTVEPSLFTLDDGAAQELTVTVDLAGADVREEWVFGDVILRNESRPDAVMPVALYAAAAVLPQEWTISTNRDADTRTFVLDRVTSLPQATFMAAGPVQPSQDTRAIVTDPTSLDPYDGGDGVFTVLLDVPQDTLWLHTETLASPADDLDLYVGRDLNGNGRADEDEEVCRSTTPEDLELCDIFEPRAGLWWVVVQNWWDVDIIGEPPPTTEPQDATLVYAVVTAGPDARVTATGPGRTEGLEPFEVQVSWRDVGEVPGTPLLGAVGIGADAQSGSDVGVIPLNFRRTGIAPQRATPTAVFPGRTRSFALAGVSVRDDFYFDVPASARSLTVLARGAVNEQTENLSIELYRRPFEDAFVPGSPLPPPRPTGAPVASDPGGENRTPTVTLEGDALQPGRWYVAVSNGAGSSAEVGLEVELEHDAATVPMQNGMLDAQNVGRPGISQGIDYGEAGPNRAVLWYTYGNDGLPTWYLASAPTPVGDSWVADLLRFTNDGSTQQATRIGDFSITLLGEGEGIMTWSFDGLSGSDRLAPTVAGDCPSVDGEPRSYTGIWGIDQPGALVDGIGGATVVMNAGPQAQVHYLYDDSGNPRWLIGANSDSSAEDIPLLQFTGQCPTCAGVADEPTTVGVVTREYTSETAGSWTLDYLLQPPLSGDVTRTDAIFKITDRYDCD